MRGRRIIRTGVALIISAYLVLYLGSSLIGATENSQPPYYISDVPIQLVVDGMSRTNSERAVQSSWSFYVTREAEQGETLFYGLSTLEDREGNTFPREYILVQTPYDSAWQGFSSMGDRVPFLDGKERTAEIKIGVFCGARGRAGRYTGHFFSSEGAPIPIEVEVKPYTMVLIEPRVIHFDAQGGPGTYQADESVTVMIHANHGNWDLTMRTEGLFYQAQDNEGEDRIFSEIWIQTDGSDEAVCLGDGLRIIGSTYGWGISQTFTFWTTFGWEHPAGLYEGVISVDMLLDN